MPGNAHIEKGHKNGVGRNCLLCVGISIRMCSGHASRKIGICLKIRNTAIKTAATTKRLWVMPYIVNTHFGIRDKSGFCHVNPFFAG